MLDYSPTNDGWTEQRSEQERARLRCLSAGELEKEIEAGEFMCSPRARWGGEPREAFVIQLRLAIEEKTRRAAE